MDKKIGVIASDKELEKSIIELFREDVEQGRIIIDILDPDNIEKQGKILENKGAKAIIARSGGYSLTVGKVNIPVIQLKITTLDILFSIKTASEANKDIVLIISDIEYFDYEEWKSMISGNVIIERFSYKEEIEKRVNKYLYKKEQVIIVGGGIPCSYAQRLGIEFVHLGASNESIHEVITYARELVDNLYEQKYKNEVLKTILDGVHDAVVAVDQEGKIILYNERAEELLKKDSSDVVDKQLLDVYPELGFIMDVMENKINRYNEIKVLKKIVIAANTSILEVDKNIHGVLCSFQDITKLQSLEKKIRYELNKKGLVTKYEFQDIITYDPVMKNTLAKARKIGLTDSTVMIYGESGTGKEMIAQSIHNISSRKNEPFVAINCAAISESLLESELFGYEEGAFTGARKGGKPGLFELAHGGSIFLDEINSVSLNLQAKLLRVLEEKEVMRIGSDYVIPLDVRIISAANEELRRKAYAGNFRRDLFYRLNILELHIPPLRERKMDILPLFKHYLKKLDDETDGMRVDGELEKRLVEYSWPGNVRELRNIAQRYVIFKEVNLNDLEIIETGNQFINEAREHTSEKVLDLKEINRYVEEKVIDMLTSSGMSKTEMAKQLGISRTALWKKTKS
ncbi:sigma 54-interacting transcriptional regulator [Clostridium sp.]|uniref:sigma 54-interacting transcriptional regulator n=1 Tax=Clostridium sp. TaxID=1506 RepID=UPI001A629133|nr:sigma 54-interacting transcriptional regulator [Clostridium sp.]MBK5241774.1 sigma 54-interacting transcriptional regulator [Clostridium sp.]